jgi:soluble lytic murein transglycosylase-like protein
MKKINYKIMLILWLISLVMSFSIAKYGNSNPVDIKHDELTVISQIINIARSLNINKKYIKYILAITETESNFRNIHKYDVTCISYGPMQVKLNTAKFIQNKYKKLNHHLIRLKLTDFNMRDININNFFGILYFKWQIKRYKGNVKKAISAYNAGTACKKCNIEYVDKVLKLSNQWLYFK